MIWSENINICCNVEQLYSKSKFMWINSLANMNVNKKWSGQSLTGQTASSGPGLTNITCNLYEG